MQGRKPPQEPHGHLQGLLAEESTVEVGAGKGVSLWTFPVPTLEKLCGLVVKDRTIKSSLGNPLGSRGLSFPNSPGVQTSSA